MKRSAHKPRFPARLLTILLALTMLTGLLGCSAIGPLMDSAFPTATATPEATSEAFRPESTPENPETPPPQNTPESTLPAEIEEPAPNLLDEHGSYDQKDDVALFLHTYDRLPDNFITKAKARDLGWSGGSVEQFAPGKCIGGDRFGNYEGRLPTGDYRECDIDTLGKTSRGAKRIVFSAGAIYYTDDHYETFTQLFPGDAP